MTLIFKDTKEVLALYRELHERRLKLLNSFTPEELATISTGSRDSILWNIAHCVVTQRLYCCTNSNLSAYLNDNFIVRCRRGTVPGGHVPTTTEAGEVRSLVFSILDHLEVGHVKGIFKHYSHYLTGVECPLTNINEAICFSISHEGIYSGSVLTLKHAVAGK